MTPVEALAVKDAVTFAETPVDETSVAPGTLADVIRVKEADDAASLAAAEDDAASLAAADDPSK
jgi:hypothetical protein